MRPVPPRRSDLADAGFLAALFALALLGFHPTYTGWAFFGVGLAGLALGVLVGFLAAGPRQPVITVAFLTVVVFFLLGGVVATRERVFAGVLPTADSVTGLAELSVHAWKQLLTTLPPVDGSGPLLVIPYILGLLCGAGGCALARRLSAPAAPLAAPLLVLAAVILLGTGEESWTVLGVGFAVVALAWAGVRSRRGRRSTSGGARRAATALALLGVGGGVVGVLGALLPGAAHRVVLRDYVEPPFEIGVYASPLVGFRKYSENANQLWDQVLFRVTGLPEGERVRIAALDDYDGSVWAATNGSGQSAGFQRVGARIPAGDGRAVELTVTVEAAYESAEEVNAWLPGAGRATRIEFTGPRAAAHAEQLRYNLATSSGVVADRLRAGDRYTVQAVLPPGGLPDDVQPYGRPALSELAFVRGKAQQWAGGASTLGAKLRAVAAHLRDNGAYTDGGPGETEYLPGHGLARMSAFFNAPKPVGDDEQYAAAYALVANHLGIPARVVLGATPGADGVVRGQDVHAWVELHVADGRWVPVTDFVPDRSKRPDRQPPQRIENTEAAVVPPPNAMRLPDSLTDAGRVDANSGRRGVAQDGVVLPSWLLGVLGWVGPPVLLAAAVVGAIALLKTRRRVRRRTTGPMALRVAQAWRDLVDHGRDLGARVPAGRTRLEEAEHLAHAWTEEPVVAPAHTWPVRGAAGDAPLFVEPTVASPLQLRELARSADAAVFGPGEPTAEAVAEFWARVTRARKSLGHDLPRWRRLRGAVSLRSFRAP
ncbi:DUF3488 and transglutaminase-like domain-containing protein [Saccharothrix obliqua]|uniref:DUF3488 and transglutaminase-like domain-containing protein n=1 Tax=Saccharothrix obliqua TaxID=2861747 RepID=UPI001C5F51AC|nr:transglutaminase domain-containing protein [Saccharothrix obliqua]MBW4720622.1 DUF3488 and transglutaminase-like domain-containing protein [Saccharothrix obliqua]